MQIKEDKSTATYVCTHEVFFKSSIEESIRIKAFWDYVAQTQAKSYIKTKFSAFIILRIFIHYRNGFQSG
jgi:hypothetical protein